MIKPIVKCRVQLKKFEMKGGWTYVALPYIKPNSNSKFGFRKVCGSIDDYEISAYHLMPMGNKKLFLPVKKAIRKVIKKEVGDYVEVILYDDTSKLEIPEEFLLCLHDDTEALNFFNTIRESEKKYYVQWIYSAKRESTRVQRIAIAINKLAKKMLCYQKEEF